MCTHPATLLRHAALVVLAVTVAGCGKNSEQPSCELTEITAGGACGCDLQLPVDTTLQTGQYLLWPFGLHGGGHPEGHRGWDFVSDTQLSIYAPGAGTVVQFDTSVQDEDAEGTAPYIKLDCGVVVSFQPMRPDAAIKVGTHVTKGQRLGVMSPVFGTYVVHFDTRTRADTPSEGTICPTAFFGPSPRAQMATLLAASDYTEKTAHVDSAQCNDGTTLSLNVAAEDQLCNARLPAAQAQQIKACMTSNQAGVW